MRFVPKIYGFKIFGMRGSRYELKYDYAGRPVNEDEIREVLERDPVTDAQMTPLATHASSTKQP